MTRLDDVAVGDRLATLTKDITRPQLFRYSAATWNAHRIHYDTEHARETEGHPDVLVQAHMHGAVAQQLLMDWLGTDGELVALGWRNTGRATPENPLSVEAEVTAIDEDERTIDFDVWTHIDERQCAEGTATVRLEE